jgi:hypothetical protein
MRISTKPGRALGGRTETAQTTVVAECGKGDVRGIWAKDSPFPRKRTSRFGARPLACAAAHWPTGPLARAKARSFARASIFRLAHGTAQVASGSGRLERCHVCFPRFGALEAAFGRDSCLQSTFEGESRLTAAAGEV